MNLQDAKNITLKHKNSAETIHVTGDGTIYLNGSIEAIEKHANENNLEIFHVKPEKIEAKKSKPKN